MFIAHAFLFGGNCRAEVVWQYDLKSSEVTVNKLNPQMLFPVPFYYSTKNKEIIYFSNSGEVSDVLSIDREYDLNISDDGMILYLFKPGLCVSCAAAIPVRIRTRDETIISEGEFNCIMYHGLSYSPEHELFFYPGGSVSGGMRFFSRDFKIINADWLEGHDIMVHDHIMTPEMIVCEFDEMIEGYSSFIRTKHDNFVGALSYEGRFLWQFSVEDMMVVKHLSIEPKDKLIVYGYINIEHKYSILVLSFTGDEIHSHEFESLDTAISSNLINGSFALYDYNTESVSLYKMASGKVEFLFPAAGQENGGSEGKRFSVRNIQMFPNGYIALEAYLLSTSEHWTMTILYDSMGNIIDKAIGTESRYNSWNPNYFFTDRIIKSVADSINFRIEEIN